MAFLEQLLWLIGIFSAKASMYLGTDAEFVFFWQGFLPEIGPFWKGAKLVGEELARTKKCSCHYSRHVFTPVFPLGGVER